jgi:hypothetical protein
LISLLFFFLILLLDRGNDTEPVMRREGEGMGGMYRMRMCGFVMDGMG